MTAREKPSYPPGVDADIVEASSPVVVVANEIQVRVIGAPNSVPAVGEPTLVSGVMASHPPDCRPITGRVGLPDQILTERAPGPRLPDKGFPSGFLGWRLETWPETPILTKPSFS